MKVIILLSFLVFASAVEFEIHNNVPRTVWIGILSWVDKPALVSSGFSLNRGQSRTVSANNDWAGRFWARTWCDPNGKHCQTGECGNGVECIGNGAFPPVTLVEITLRGWKGQDFYDVSLNDGFNVKATIEPVNGRGKCRSIRCKTEINDRCPQELQQLDKNNSIFIISDVVGCHSSCTKFHTDQYCCRGQYAEAQTCNTNQWPVNSAAVFKSACPDAYSYAYDDAVGIYTCVADRYRVTFG